jgi:hypothetical protein
MMPHAPQLPGSLERSVQPMNPPQSVCPVAQVHLPATHDSPLAHAVLHAPQLPGSDERSTQPAVVPQ